MPLLLINRLPRVPGFLPGAAAHGCRFLGEGAVVAHGLGGTRELLGIASPAGAVVTTRGTSGRGGCGTGTRLPVQGFTVVILQED